MIYGCAARPPAWGGCPSGFVAFGSHPDFPNGTVEYVEPLSPDVAGHWSLIEIPTPERVAEIVADVAAQFDAVKVGLWRDLVATYGPVNSGFAAALEWAIDGVHVDRDVFADMVGRAVGVLPCE